MLAYCVRKVGNGQDTSFWHEVWVGDRSLKDRFPRVYALDREKSCCVADRVGSLDWEGCLRRWPRGGIEMHQFTGLTDVLAQVTVTGGRDSWVWNLDSEAGYSVRSARLLIDGKILDVAALATRWNRMLPAKINVFAWRLMLNRIPTKVNLDRRGIDCGSIRCQVCDEDLETANHLFFSCELAIAIWSKIATWWDIDIPMWSSMLEWAN